MTPPLFSFGRRRRAATRSRDEREDLRDGTPAPAPPEAVAEIAPAPPPTVAPVDEVARGEELARSVSSELVEKALERWRQDLLDLGGAASLDDLAALDDVVDLTAAHPSGIAQLYAGRPTHLSSLVRERNALSVVRQSLREVAGRTDALARQFGVAPVYLAIGVATWTEPLDPSDEAYAEQMAALIDAGPAGDQEADGIPVGARGDLPTVPTPMVPTRTIHAPVLLRPVHLASTSSEASLTLAPSIEVNPVLTRALREAGSRADVEAIARATMTASGFTPSAAITSIGALGREHLTSFEISERLVVGAFVHPGQALVDDFDATVERARASALVAALAGDESGRTALDVALDPPDGLDRAPELERGAGDLDVGQHDAVEAVSSGACLLLDAPPGSDVAATLAAVIADAAGSGRTVLHVPATSADGHAVADALRELGLEGMILDLTEDPAWRRNAGEQIKLSLGAQPPELDVAGILDLRDRLAALRGRLSASVTALHERRRPWGASAYEALQQLAEFTTGRSRTRTSVRINPFHLEQLDEGGRQRARVLLRRAYHLGMLSPDSSSSAWSELSLDDVDEATDALARLARLADELLPRVRAHAEDAASQTGMRRAASLDQWCDQLEMLDGVRESLDVFKPEVFERSAADMVIATATRQWRDARALEMSASDRRRFTRQAKDLVRPGRMVHDLHAELVKAQQRRENWRVHDPEGGWPSLPRGLDEMQAAADQAREAVLALQPIIASKPDAPVLIDMPMEALEDLANSLADDDEAAQKIPEVNRVSDELARMGLTELVEDLAARRVAVDDIEPEFDYCWWASLLGRLLREDPALKGLESGLLAERTAELAELDAAQVATLAGPVAQAWARRVRAAVDQDKESARSLYRALSREDGIPLREILAAHPVAFVAKPVWIVPPTLVPQILSPEAVVDLAVLDASAHMPVAQVLPAFVRAEQVLVVGDPRRATSGLASELGPLLPSVTLPTTRNMLDAQIAGFLAANGYEGVVEAIPSPPGADNLTLELVDGRGMPAPGQTAVESVPAEVERVVDLVIEHALSRPDQSLGVVALNARHAEEIRRATGAAVVGSPALEEFFAGGIAEPFVVVDLSEARSLRRDHVIVSLGYAKTPHGRTIHSFGAVSDAGGMVGLVEALCASRGTTQVVSCLAPEDIDPERLHAPGARLLREVLVRASGQGAPIPQEEGGPVPDRLLVDLAEQLWRRGLTVVPRYGLADGVRLPLAIGHPDYPGELFVAVLTDDDDYVRESSQRRRDRHWIERLRRRGWRVHMAFSVSVFVDAQAEAAAIEALILDELTERARIEGDQPAALPSFVEEPVDTGDDIEPLEGVDEPEQAPEEAEPHALEATEDSQEAGQDRAAGVVDAQEDGVDEDAEASEGPEALEAGEEASDGEDLEDAGQADDPAGPDPAVERGPRPPIAQGLPLQAYSDDQLDDLVEWIRSDGVARQARVEVEELRSTLGLVRRGTGIDAVLANAVRRTRRRR